MKNTIKLFGALLIVFGVFVLVGSVSATAAEELQPAELVTYNEDVTVNGTMRTNSAYIGSTEAGVGGVTFFNGTMINGSVDEAGDGIPLTMGDDVRIDGEIWRTEKGGDNPIRISDHVMPMLHNNYDMGIESSRWRNMYYADTLHGGSADLSGDLAVDGAVTFGDTLAVTGATTFGGGSGHTGVTIHANGDVDVDGRIDANGVLDVDGNINAHGNIVQDRTNNGAVKAFAFVQTASGSCNIPRYFNRSGESVECNYRGVGRFGIKFNGLKVDDRFFQITPYTSGTPTFIAGNKDAGGSPDEELVRVFMHNSGGSYFDGQYFMITIY